MCSTARLISSPYRDIQAPCDSLADFIWKNINKWPKHIAICCAETGKQYSYEELRTLCRRFAVALQKKKFKKGEILTIMLPTMPEYLVILLGAIEAGLVASTLNPLSTAEEISRQFQNSKTSVIVTLHTLTELVNSAIRLIESRTKEEFRCTLITLNGSSTSKSSFEEMIDERFNDYEFDAKIEGDDVALMIYSSGTTGFPKGVQLTHSNLVHNLLQRFAGEFQEVLPAAIPLHGVRGITFIIFSSLRHGCKIILLSRFEPETYFQVLKKEKVTMLHLLPTHTASFISHPSIKPNYFESVKSLYFTSVITPKMDVDKFIELIGHKRVIVYHSLGLTETSGPICAKISNTYDSNVGPPLANTVVKIVKVDGSFVQPFEMGEICVKGPQIMKGYFNNPEATNDAIDVDGFLHTGDIGYYSNDNNIFYVERMKELIKVNNLPVPPAELEYVVKSYQGVEDVGVIGVPDLQWGEIPVAFVVPKASQQICENDLKRFVAKKVTPHKQLGQVIFTESIPRTPSGKILRRNLREKYENLN